MEHLLLIVIGILLLIIFALLTKVYFLRKSAQEIAEAFHDRLMTDTNTLIDISARDRSMRRLAASINTQLRLLRRQRHKYLTGDQELKDAVTGISHDLRTPLTAICGYLELLGREEKSENVSRYLALIENRTEAMIRLTEELFRYSVILSAEEPALETVDLRAILEESIAGLYGALVSRGITPQIELPEIPVTRHLNREALARIFANILNNALKYSDGDLSVTLHSSGEVVFRNHAEGLDEVQVGKLFDRFFTVEAARNSTGLGLSIAKALAEQMDGQIRAEYTEGVLGIHLLFPN